MTESVNPKVAAGKARASYPKTATQFEELVHDTQLPATMRAFAENNIAQTRELDERSKDAFEGNRELGEHVRRGWSGRCGA